MNRDWRIVSFNNLRSTIHVLALTVVVTLGGCGVETASTAVTGAAIKKQEMDQGKKTLEQTQQKVEQAAQQMQQRAEQGRDASEKQ